MPMQENPTVTVVIPVYNATQYIDLAISSILAQTYQDFEVILVDDGSTDDVAGWFETVTDPRIRLIRQENQGPSAARNTGIAAATGEYVALLDADDVWHPTKLEAQLARIVDDDAVGLVYCWLRVVDPKGTPTGRQVCNRQEGDVWISLMVRNIVACGSVPLVRRAAFQAAGPFDVSLRADEDRDMWLRIAERYRFALVPEILVDYRSHGNNISRDWNEMLRCTDVVNGRSISRNAGNLPPTQLAALSRRCLANAYFRTAWAPLKADDPEILVGMSIAVRALRYDLASVVKGRLWRLLAYLPFAVARKLKRTISRP